MIKRKTKEGHTFLNVAVPDPKQVSEGMRMEVMLMGRKDSFVYTGILPFHGLQPACR